MAEGRQNTGGGKIAVVRLAAGSYKPRRRNWSRLMRITAAGCIGAGHRHPVGSPATRPVLTFPARGVRASSPALDQSC